MGVSHHLDHVLWNLAECLRLVAEALRPFSQKPPSASRRISV